MAEARDYRQSLTDKLVELLEAGTAPWQKPWDAKSGLAEALPYNPTTNKPYRGANSLHLYAVALDKSYGDPRWATYRQALDAGWQVRRGEKGSLIEYWKFSSPNDDELSAADERQQRKAQVFRAVVFNLAQMDGAPSLSTEKVPAYDWDPLERAEALLKSSGARILYDQNDRAFYHLARDEIHLPAREQFPDAAKFYSTALHELGHHSGHPSRLARKFGSFGSVDYAKEELRAELASYFLSHKLGVPHDPSQHAAYAKSWIEVLKNDKNEIFRAARDAEKIADFVLALDRNYVRDSAAQEKQTKGFVKMGEKDVVATHQKFEPLYSGLQPIRDGLARRFPGDQYSQAKYLAAIKDELAGRVKGRPLTTRQKPEEYHAQTPYPNHGSPSVER